MYYIDNQNILAQYAHNQKLQREARKQKKPFPVPVDAEAVQHTKDTVNLRAITTSSPKT